MHPSTQSEVQARFRAMQAVAGGTFLVALACAIASHHFLRPSLAFAAGSLIAGALVFLNDVEIGTTPVEADFSYYGTYDVRLTKPGFEPLLTKAEARAPLYEYPPVDLAASALPRIETKIRWHFVMQRSLEAEQEPEAFTRDLIERAKKTADGE